MIGALNKSFQMVSGGFDTKSFQYKPFRYKSKSIRYICEVDSMQTEVVSIQK